MLNRSPVEHARANNERDSSLPPKPQALAFASANAGAVGERSALGRRATVRTPGRSRSDHAGTSSDKAGENPASRKPKVSWGR